MNVWPRLRRALGVDAAEAPHRWAVVDVEASGLDPRHDRLIAVAAVAVTLVQGAPRIAFGDSFEVVLRQPALAPDKANILLHGIGVGAQREGVEPGVALAAFERWLDGAPLLAFHAAFDEMLLQRAMRAVLGHSLASEWVDLEPVAAALHPAQPGRSLDAWLSHFGITCAARHQAAADALATAELLLRLWPALCRQDRAPGFAALRRLASQGRWLQR